MGAKVGVAKGAVSDLNLTPLIDIVLVVLIIMMVNIPIQIDEMGIKLPSNEVPNPPPPPNPDQLVVAIYEDGRFALNRRVMSEDVLVYELTRRLGPMANKNVFIDGAAKAPYGSIVHLVDVARESGAVMVGLAKLKDTGPLEPTSVAPGAMPKGVVLGTPRVVGDIEQSAAMKAMTPLKSSFEGCYATRLAAIPDLSGRLQVKAVIGPQGEHMEPPSLAEGGTIEDAELIACVTPYLPNLRFDPLGPSKTAVALFPILFSPG